jgi:hypothetical protein
VGRDTAKRYVLMVITIGKSWELIYLPDKYKDALVIKVIPHQDRYIFLAKFLEAKVIVVSLDIKGNDEKIIPMQFEDGLGYYFDFEIIEDQMYLLETDKISIFDMDGKYVRDIIISELPDKSRLTGIASQKDTSPIYFSVLVKQMGPGGRTLFTNVVIYEF